MFRLYNPYTFTLYQQINSWIWLLNINILKVFLLCNYDIDVQAAKKDIKACFSLSAHFSVAD